MHELTISALASIGASLADAGIDEHQAKIIADNVAVRVSKGCVNDNLPSQKGGSLYVMHNYFYALMRNDSIDEDELQKKLSDLNAPKPHELLLM